MSIFEWDSIDLERLRSSFIHGMDDAATSESAQDMFHAAIKPDEENQGRLARTRWLERNRAEYVDDEERFAFRSVWLAQRPSAG